MNRWIVLLLCIGLIGCKGIPEQDRKAAKNLEPQIERAQEFVSEKQSDYKETKQTDEFDFFRPYASRQNWDSLYTAAGSKLDRARNLYEKEVKSILERDDPKQADRLERQVKRVSRIITEARKLAQKPQQEMKQLERAREEGPKLVAGAEENLTDASNDVQGLVQTASLKKSEFPDKSKKIEAKVAPVQEKQQTARQELQAAKSELKKPSSETDYGKLVNKVERVNQLAQEMADNSDAVADALESLDRSYYKRLIDRRDTYFITPGRSSWDNSRNGTNRNYVYPQRETSWETYDYFSNQPSNSIIADYGSWGGLNVRVKKSMWNNLNIDSKKDWPSSSHDTAQFWLKDWSEKYEHRYEILSIVDGDTTRKTKWEQVDWKEYSKHREHTGMMLASKPQGVFASEKVTSPTPPGMAAVGNEKYGEWKTRDDGTEFWEFYGKYAFFSNMMGSNHHYTRTEYRQWNRNYRNRRAYRGSGGSGGRARYGSRSARRVSGGLRGAGRATRGGGPGKGK